MLIMELPFGQPGRIFRSLMAINLPNGSQLSMKETVTFQCSFGGNIWQFVARSEINGDWTFRGAERVKKTCRMAWRGCEV